MLHCEKTNLFCTTHLQEFERMGEMTREAVSSVEVKFADLLSKVERWAHRRL